MKNRAFLLIAALALLLGLFPGCQNVSEPPVSGKTYYVDANQGDDANDGLSENAPLRTIDKVNTLALGAGDSVLFHSGQTFPGMLKPNGEGSEGHPLVFDRYGEGDKPVIDGSGNPFAVMIEDRQYLTLQNLQIINKGETEEKRSGIYLLAGVWDGFGKGVRKSIAFKNLDIHDIDGICSRVDNIMYENSGIIVYKGNIEDTNSRFDGLLIENCHIHDLRTSGIVINGAGKTPAELHQNVVLRGNLIERTGSDGAIVGSCNTPLLERNRVLYAGKSGVGFQYVAGLWTYACHNSVVQYNEVAYTQSDGAFVGDSAAFDTDISSTGDHLYQYNYTHDNVGGTLMTMDKENSPDLGKVIYRFNVSENDGRYNCSPNNTFSLYHDGHYIYNNTIYNDMKLGLQINASKEGESNDFRNNLFYISAPVGFNGSETGNVYHNNLYFGGMQGTIPEASPLSADPKLASPGKADDGPASASSVDEVLAAVAAAYRPAADSPVKESGIAAPLAADDLEPELRSYFTDTDFTGAKLDLAHLPVGAIAP